jgi:hypothetical protein
MKTKILVLVGILTIAALAGAVISSYGSVTGYATVEQAISIDIMGTSNDEVYELNTVHQGDTEYSPEIKLVNKANEPIDVIVSVGILPESSGNESDVVLSLTNEFNNETLANPITVPTTDLRIHVKHDFANNANLGNYSFSLNVEPA